MINLFVIIIKEYKCKIIKSKNWNRTNKVILFLDFIHSKKILLKHCLKNSLKSNRKFYMILEISNAVGS